MYQSLTAVKKYWYSHNIQEQIDTLHESMATREVAEVKQDWESLDHDNGRAIKLGEKAIKKPPRVYA